MTKTKYILVLDAGTSSVKSFLFEEGGTTPLKMAEEKIQRHYPQANWVEQDPQKIIDLTIKTLTEVTKNINLKQILGLGISTQRESIVLWSKNGKPFTPVIVWEDKRSQKLCDIFKEERIEGFTKSRTGLPIDPYFSGPKLSWVAKNIPLPQKDIYWGTVDSWLLFNLTQNSKHQTDYTNASRTLLFNIKTLKWDEDLKGALEIPKNFLFPQVQNSWGKFGKLKKKFMGLDIPILAVSGDQQASLFAAGEFKITYGTGGFVMQDTGGTSHSVLNLFTTLTPSQEKLPHFALEGKVENVGKRVDELLQKGEDLKPLLYEIATQVNELIGRFPKRPKEAVADGGVTQDPQMIPIQEEVSGIKIKAQTTYHGTALGVAELVKQALES